MVTRGRKPLPSEEDIRRQTARSIAELFDGLYDGAFAVDLDGRITWMNHKFKALLGWNGLEPVEGRPVEEVVPNSMMRAVAETGRPNLLDIVPIGERQVVVSRIPLMDEAGQATGAVGVILYDRLDALKPLVAKFQGLQKDLEQARKALAESRRAKYGFASILGQSAPARQMKRLARQAATRDATVLLLGETGTGKELLAHAIHAAGTRAQGPMVRFNLAAIPESLLEAELFGAAPGAYTGADRKGRIGKFELADGGTVFLDEIGDLPLALQPKLLRVLDDQEVEPLGSNRVRQVNTRVIAATSRPLEAMVEAGNFRADLFYRLNVLPIRLPPLRDRRDDIALIADSLLQQLRDRNGTGPQELDPAAVARLTAHDWPGNIRELRNVLEQAAIRAESAEVLVPAHLDGLVPDRPGHGMAPAASTGDGEAGPVRPLRAVLAEAEAAAIAAALAATGGNRTQAARLLGISRAQFYEKLQGLEETPPARATA